MISIEETKKWLSKNRVDENGDINLNDLDFSDFDGNVYISNMKVKGNLYQDSQEVKGLLSQSWQKVEGDLHQGCQEVEGDLRQSFQEVKGMLNQSWQKVEGDLHQTNQKVKGNLCQDSQEVKGKMYLQDTSNLSKCTNSLGIICYREIPEMTLEELEKIVGYKFKLKETGKCLKK